MARQTVLVFALVCALMNPLHQVKAQDELHPDLVDPMWEQFSTAFGKFTSLYQVSNIERIKANSIFGVAAYDALACYSDFDGLVVGDTLRRPPGEWAIENKRKAIAYAIYRAITTLWTSRATSTFDPVMAALNFNINDYSEDEATPVGIGNLVAKAILQSQYNDQAKVEVPAGARGRGRFRNPRKYVPRNTAYLLRYKTRWQPLEVVVLDEIYVQSYFADEMVRKPTITGFHPSYFQCPPPTDILYPFRPEYRAAGDKVLEKSRSLNDTGKMLAEGVDGGFGDNGATFLINKYRWNFDHQVIWAFVTAMVGRESLIVSAYYKTWYDTIRPISLIRSSGLYDRVEAWAGPGMGVQEIPAAEFRQYNTRTDPSPEYPSGACTTIGAYAAVARNFLGTDEFGWSRTFEAGSSKVEQGTPKTDITFNMPTFSSYEDLTIEGRLTGLVHFDFAATNGVALGEQVGEELYKKLSALLKTDLLAI